MYNVCCSFSIYVNCCCFFCTDLGSKKHEITTGLSSSGLWDQQVLSPIRNTPSPTSQKVINGQLSRHSYSCLMSCLLSVMYMIQYKYTMALVLIQNAL